MGIVNVTPDSFSDGGRYLDPDAAIAHGRELLVAGADVLDVGGESTRPGARAVSAAAEKARVLPVIGELAAGGARVSIDTSKAEVAAAALGAGASIVNDVTALGDPEMAAVCADARCGVVLMHMKGTPRTMQDDPTYDDVVAEVRGFLAGRLAVATAAGIEADRVWLDPGIGFGKTVDHNVELIARIDRIADIGRTVVVGASRKNFIGAVTGRPVEERLGGSIAAGLAAVAGGAGVLRVHDVAATVEALRIGRAIAGDALAGTTS